MMISCRLGRSQETRFIMQLFLVITIMIECLSRHSVESARILVVLPLPSKSHQIVFQTLTIELSRRGHELVIFTCNPINDPELKNYTEIDLHRNHNPMKSIVTSGNDPVLWFKEWSIAAASLTESVLSHPEMQRIIRADSREHFDLIIIEYYDFYAIHGLMLRLNAPVIGMLTLPLSPLTNHLIGNPIAAAYTPGMYDSIIADSGIWGRFLVTYQNLRLKIINHYEMYSRQQEILNKYFGPDMPDAYNLAADVSLVLVNDHTVLGYPSPNVPNVIKIGGISLVNENKTKGLDTDTKKFLDDAVNGFVYFSLGSNVKSKDLSDDIRNTLIRAFAELPYRVLWKWELDTLPGKPKNVLTSKWLSQRDVLAHPNIKVFVYQGGLQSTEEAIKHAVPVIGIPICFDQGFLVNKLTSLNVGKRVNLDSLSEDELKNAILEIATDESYKERMAKYRDLMFDEPDSPLERAVWWTEYVIRHKGAPHLRTRVRHMAWYERELLDILAFVIIIALVSIYVTYKAIRYSIIKLVQAFNSKTACKLKIG